MSEPDYAHRKRGLLFMIFTRAFHLYGQNHGDSYGFP